MRMQGVLRPAQGGREKLAGTSCCRAAVSVAIAAFLAATAPPPGNTASTADFTRLVVLGDGFAAGEADGTLFDGQSAPVPVPLGQRESFASHLGAAMDTAVVFPRIEYPGRFGRNQVILKPGHCEFEADAFTVGFGLGGRVDPFEVPNVVAVPEQRVRDALDRRWDIDPQDLSTVDTVEDLILGLPFAFLPAPPASQVETALAQVPTFAVVWLGNEDVLAAARRGDAEGLTPSPEFREAIEEVLDALVASGAGAAVANIPDPTVLPLFMPEQELFDYLVEHRDPEDPVEPDVTHDGIRILLGVPRRGYMLRTFQAFASAEGIGDGLQPAPLPGNLFLSAREVRRIRLAVRRYNAAIAAAAAERGIVLVDVHGLFEGWRGEGVDAGGRHLATGYLGGLFGLDGIHPTNSGHALIAGAVLDAINRACGTDLEGPDLDAVVAADPLAICSGPAR